MLSVGEYLEKKSIKIKRKVQSTHLFEVKIVKLFSTLFFENVTFAFELSVNRLLVSVLFISNGVKKEILLFLLIILK